MSALPVEKIIFTAMAVFLLVWLLKNTKEKDSKTFATLFSISFLIVMGFYLLNFGTLSQFSIEGLSAKAQFIRDTADDAGKLKDKIEQDAERIQQTASDVSTIKERLDAIAKAAAPRGITKEQKDALFAALKDAPKGPVRVIQGAGDGETTDYCKQVRAMLDEAGYEAIKAPNDYSPNSFVRSKSGTYTVGILGNNQDSGIWVPLENALNNNVIPCTIWDDGSGKPWQGPIMVLITDKAGH